MLWIYAGIDILKAKEIAMRELPDQFIDISKISLEDLTKTMQDIYDHHSSGHVFVGYLDPLLMLHPTEEAKLRKCFEKFDMSIVVSNPLILPLSWKNGTSRLRIIESYHQENASKPEIIDNGSASHVQHEAKHGGASAQATDQRDTDKGGEKGSAPKRRKQKRQNQAPKS
jgi:hypothetical protein